MIRKIREEMEFYNITKVINFFNKQSRELRFINFEASQQTILESETFTKYKQKFQAKAFKVANTIYDPNSQ